MISTCNEAGWECAKYLDADGFCTRNCSCSGLSFGGCKADYDAAHEEAAKAGITTYVVMTGKCGDRYVIPTIDGVMQ